MRVVALLLFLAGALAAAGVPAQTGSSLQVVLEPSRTGGVAPLMVFFDASATTDPKVTRRPFRELEYRWNFGDVDPKWQAGSRAGSSSKNLATGPVAAHVYETPGVYRVTVAVFDGVYTVTRQVTVTVDDPAVVFAGSKTVCFSNGRLGFEGCPAGAQRVKTADFSAAINGYKTTARRLLFRRGETFSSSKPATIGVDGPGVIGAFGPPSEPRPVLWSTANANTLQFSGATTPNIRDWRVTDLTLLGSNQSQSYGVALVGGIDRLSLLRLSVRRQRVAVIADAQILDHFNKTASTAGHHIWDQLAFMDCNVSEVKHSLTITDKGYGTYIAADRLFYAGNVIDNAGTAAPDVSHVARFTYLGKAVISNNTLMNPGPNEHLIKLHAPVWGDTTTTEHRAVGKGYTRWVLISDNKLVGANNAWLMALGPQNGGRDERVLEAVVERNWFVGGPGMQVAQMVWATAVTLRNNIVDASAGSRWQGGIATIGRRGIEPPSDRVSVFNETYYTTRKLDGGQFVAFSLGTGTTNVTARNNLAYAPAATNPVMFKVACGACLTQSNNSTDSLINTKLPFVLAWPRFPADYRPAGYAVGNGTAVPAWLDFFWVERRTRTRDIGALAR